MLCYNIMSETSVMCRGPVKCNFELSCSLLDTLSATLVESRWQRDLTDSTTQRNIGSALGYSQLALYNLMGGLKSIHPNDIVIERELDSNWEVLGEPIQTAMRACELKGLPGMDKPFQPDAGWDYNPAADYHGGQP